MENKADFYFYRKDLRKYESAGTEDKVRFILQNFSGFDAMLNTYEEFIRISIEEESLYNRRKEAEDPGIRVQTGGNGNPTQSRALWSMELKKAVKSGNLDAVLEYADDPELHEQDCFILSDMKSDYEYTVEAIQMLKPRDRKLYLRYLKGETNFYGIAQDFGIQYQSAKNRISRIRVHVISTASRILSVKYGENRRDWICQKKA